MLRATCTVVPRVVVLLFCTHRSCCVHTCVVHVHCSVLLCYCCALLSNSLCYCCAVHASPVLCTTSVACTSLVLCTQRLLQMHCSVLPFVLCTPRPNCALTVMCTYQVLHIRCYVLQANMFLHHLCCTQNSCVLCTSSLVRMLGFMSSVVHLFDLTTPIVEDP